MGRQNIFHEVAARTATPVVATGLAVTGVGGDVLFVEAATMAVAGGWVLTGQLGGVVKKSASIALIYVRSHAAPLGIPDEAFSGLTEVILPPRNAPELEDMPAGGREHMRFHAVSTIGEVLALALEPAVLTQAA